LFYRVKFRSKSIAKHPAGKAGASTVAAQIGDILSNTANYQSGIRAIGLRIAEQAVIPMFASSALAERLLGTESAVAVLNTGFGFTLRAAAPIAMLNFLRIASLAGDFNQSMS
jgi:hypothetical protein